MPPDMALAEDEPILAPTRHSLLRTWSARIQRAHQNLRACDLVDHTAIRPQIYRWFQKTGQFMCALKAHSSGALSWAVTYSAYRMAVVPCTCAGKRNSATPKSVNFKHRWVQHQRMLLVFTSRCKMWSPCKACNAAWSCTDMILQSSKSNEDCFCRSKLETPVPKYSIRSQEEQDAKPGLGTAGIAGTAGITGIIEFDPSMQPDDPSTQIS